MSKEIEKRFKNFKYNEIKKILKDNNIKKKESYLFSISSFYGIKDNQIIRTRNEGSKITFTIKMKNSGSYDTEWEVVVDNQKMMDKMLEQLNIKKKYTLEKFRKIYETDDGKTQIVFDLFPGLNSYMEVESKMEGDLHKIMEMLHLNNEPNFGSKDLYWEEYGITKDRPDVDLTFETADKVLGPYITKNKEKFEKILANQLKTLNN
jgi:adenylate cyclase class IV